MIGILLAVVTAAAPFEGVITQQLKMRGGEGTMKVQISAAGVRSEAQVKVGPNHQTSTTVLITARATDQAYVKDQTGAWRKLPVIPDTSSVPAVLEGKRLGKKTVAGHSCDQVRLTGGEVEVDYCLAPKLLTPSLVKLVRKAAMQAPQVEKALAKLGVSGMVLEMIHKKAGTTEITLTTTAVQEKKLEPALFLPPAGI